ncbi:hypothetical protein MNBD_GAMMA12-2453 [hydrothermal vent metagenome]|uniref:Rsd/AlgQ family anti-sigma factor n=1 Tax=hydrothermal vent metagenome TaxID=652676 RepID=A0A3B0Y2L2_9ZZZZ
MLTSNQQASDQPQERRGESRKLIKELIHTRTELLSLLSRLVAFKPFEEELDEEVQETLTEFCEILIDYTADAHFRLYRFIDENKERRKAVLEIAESSYNKISEITRIILDFNDRYFHDIDYEESRSKQLPIKNLESDLSTLAEVLAIRIQLEDDLIEAMVKGPLNTQPAEA